MVRNPSAVRPWQHVLEPLSGYLMLAERLSTQGSAFAEGWNFGPADSDARPVEWIATRLVERWGEQSAWRTDGGPHPHEAHYLKLETSNARARLGWCPRWSLSTALDLIVDWHRAWLTGCEMQGVCLAQIALYRDAPIRSSD